MSLIDRIKAIKTIAEFDGLPEKADEAGQYSEFTTAWEFLYPDEYWMRRNMASGVRYDLIAVNSELENELPSLYTSEETQRFGSR